MTGGLLSLLVLPLLAPVLPFVAVTGGLLEVSRLFVQPDIDAMKSIMMLAKTNFFIQFRFNW